MSSHTKEYLITAAHKKSVVERNVYVQEDVGPPCVLYKDTLWNNAVFRVCLTPTQRQTLQQVSRSTETNLTPYHAKLEEALDDCGTHYHIPGDPDDNYGIELALGVGGKDGGTLEPEDIGWDHDGTEYIVWGPIRLI